MKPIALIGFMGAGKTSVGKALAERLNCEFTDTDELIVRRAGVPVSEIFREQGEEPFRDMESEALIEALSHQDAVVSCGGGIVLREGNRDVLAGGAIVVYLEAAAEEVFLRISADGDARPLLAVADPKAEIERLLKIRQPIYESVADIIIDTTGKHVDLIVDEIVEEMKAGGFTAVNSSGRSYE